MNDKALVYYEKALSLDSRHKGAHEYIGELYLKLKQPEKAKEHLAKLDSICFFGCEEFDELKMKLDQLDQRDAIIEASQARGIDMSGPREVDLQLEQVDEGIRFLKEYDLESGVDYKLRFWDDTDWIDMNGGEFRRWVFQPSGMCEPLKIQVQSEGAFFEIEFHPLTADVKRERSWVE